MVPSVIFEDDHLLVVNKPAGINTHAPSPFAGEGLYDWLKHREPRWASLAIVHRLDKETSGVMVFGKTPLANQSLTRQFTERRVRKRYLLLTSGSRPRDRFVVQSRIARAGDRYKSSPGGEPAETHFRIATASFNVPDTIAWEAEPMTGRTHQIRVHAAENGIPVLGDILYDGLPYSRLCLHAASLEFTHPAEVKPLTFAAPIDFNADARAGLRAALIDPLQTDSFRLIHGASDGWPSWYVEQLGDFLLAQSDEPPSAQQLDRIRQLAHSRGLYHKTLSRQVRRTSPQQASPRHVDGSAAPDRFTVRENGVRFELSFQEGYSVGLFLDQRDNRRRLLTGHVAARFDLPRPVGADSSAGREHPGLLNVFAYTCGFSVCGAIGGYRTTSLDLSRKYLDWGRNNFMLNGLDPAGHDFIYGDAFEWMRRLGRKGRSFDVIVLDPPTFSQSREHGVFRAEKDYGRLIQSALPLLKPEGVLLASTNAAEWNPEAFVDTVLSAVRSGKRMPTQEQYVPQPPDFPVSRSEPAYLKTLWVRVK